MPTMFELGEQILAAQPFSARRSAAAISSSATASAKPCVPRPWERSRGSAARQAHRSTHPASLDENRHRERIIARRIAGLDLRGHRWRSAHLSLWSWC